VFGFNKNKKVSAKKMRSWIEHKRIEKVVDLLQKGDSGTRLKAIELLSKINLIQVKNALIVCLDDKERAVALKAVESLEIMGMVPDERAKVEACKRRWKEKEPSLIMETKESFVAKPQTSKE